MRWQQIIICETTAYVASNDDGRRKKRPTDNCSFPWIWNYVLHSYASFATDCLHRFHCHIRIAILVCGVCDHREQHQRLFVILLMFNCHSNHSHPSQRMCYYHSKWKLKWRETMCAHTQTDSIQLVSVPLVRIDRTCAHQIVCGERMCVFARFYTFPQYANANMYSMQFASY